LTNLVTLAYDFLANVNFVDYIPDPDPDGELAELTVDDIWQIADAGDQELWILAQSASYVGARCRR